MDWKLISQMLRDHQYGRDKYNNNFTLSNVVRVFGQETEFDELKVKLRPIYRELRSGLDRNNKDIEGIISDQRFFKIVEILQGLVDEYYTKHKLL